MEQRAEVSGALLVADIYIGESDGMLLSHICGNGMSIDLRA